MLYAVGTHIDLRALNEKAEPQPEPEPAQPKPVAYAVGTKILFLNMISSLDIISVKTQAA